MAKVGDQVGKWTLRRLIDDGGQGQVFAGTSAEGGEEVAVKVVKAARPKKRARFLQEVATHAALSSQGAKNIIPVLAHNFEELSDGGVQGYIVMPLAKGTLDDYRELLSGRIELCLEVFSGILEGAKAAHAANTVHRDLKPKNVLFLDHTLKNPLVSDFGICLLRETPTESRLTEVGETVGARFFMAPEQERGGVADIQPNADVYALGKLLHYMLTGRFLHRENLDEAFTAAEFGSDPRYRIILERIPARTIVTRPADRIQTAEELLKIVDDIRGYGGGDGGGGTGGQPLQQPPAEPAASEAEPETHSVVEKQAFRSYTAQLASGNAKALALQFDVLRLEFNDAWAKIHETIRTNPRAGKWAASQLLDTQPRTTAALFAIARTDAARLFPDCKRLIEHILRSSERQSGYPAVFTVPYVLAGFYYMGMSTIALHFENWDILERLLTDKFEWYYQSGRPIFTRGFALSYFFHIEALGRSASEAHNVYREFLAADSVMKDLGLFDDTLLDAYLQTQLLMSLRGAQALQKGEDIALWPDFGRFHGYRVEPILDRMYHNEQYAEQVLRSFGETKSEFFDQLNDRLVRLSGRMSGDRYFWDSISSWEPRSPSR